MQYQFEVISTSNKLSEHFNNKEIDILNKNFAWQIACMDNTQPYAKHLMVKCVANNKLVASIALTIITVNHHHLHFQKLSDIWLKQLNKLIDKKNYKVCIIGNPYKDDEKLIHFFNNNTINEGIISDFLDYTKKEKTLKNNLIIWSNNQLEEQSVLENLNFDFFPNDYVMKVKIRSNWKNIIDYKNDLSKKYRARINKLEEKTEQLERLEISINDIDQYKQDIKFLYEEVIENQTITLNIINLNFFKVMHKIYGDNFKFYGYFLNGKMLSFKSILINNHVYKTYFIGQNQSMSRTYNLYQIILFDSLKDAIKLGCKTLDIGRTALEAKAMLGAEHQIQNVYFKAKNKISQFIVYYFLEQFSKNLGTEWMQRNPFK